MCIRLQGEIEFCGAVADTTVPVPYRRKYETANFCSRTVKIHNHNLSPRTCEGLQRCDLPRRRGPNHLVQGLRWEVARLPRMFRSGTGIVRVVFSSHNSFPTTESIRPRCKGRSDASRQDQRYSSSRSDDQSQTAEVGASPSTYVVRLVKNGLPLKWGPSLSGYLLPRYPHEIEERQARTHVKQSN
jgi:hypothetical protein